MSSVSMKQWKILKQWSPILLYIAGGLNILLVLPNFFEFSLSVINALGSILYFLGPVSSILGIVGIIGLYPTLSERAPSLSRIGLICLAIAATAFIVGFVGNQLAKITQSQSLIPILSFVPYITNATAFIGCIVFSIAVFKTDYFPKILGYLLLVPAALTIIGFIIIILQAQGNMIVWILTTTLLIQALDFLVMGYIINKQHAITYPRIAAFWSNIKKVV